MKDFFRPSCEMFVGSLIHLRDVCGRSLEPIGESINQVFLDVVCEMQIMQATGRVAEKTTICGQAKGIIDDKI